MSIRGEGALSPFAEHFLASLSQARRHATPFDHWLLCDALPEPVSDAIAALPIAPPAAATFDGTREANNSSRLFFNREAQERHAVCGEVVEGFRDPRIINALELVTGADLSSGRLRIEYCQDVTGFWLKPHVDISVKLFTMLIYLSGEPALADAGTNLYDSSPEHNCVATVAYEKGGGMIFIPASDTWHGFEPRKIAGIRKSIIVNYVAPDWKSLVELA